MKYHTSYDIDYNYSCDLYDNKIKFDYDVGLGEVCILVKHYTQGYSWIGTAFTVTTHVLTYNPLRTTSNHVSTFREMKIRNVTIDEYVDYMNFLTL